MALVIGLVAAAARALASDHNNNPGYNGNGQNYNNGYNNGYNRNGYNDGYNNGYANNNYNYNGNGPAPHAPYATYGTGGRSGCRATRRMERRMRKAERKAMQADMVMSLMNSGSRSRAAVPPPPQPASGGASYMNYGEGPAPRGVYSSEAQGVVAGSSRDRMPAGAPEGYRWRDEQSRDRPVGRRDVGSSSASSSTDGLPSYEQAVQKPRKS
ncbi:hypothetical protein ACSS6W_005292 [Trichoderma asperelloides]|uniref:SSCRP protein n=1 Tax=Trichoderma asperellum TaxID=101201 RepID=A0A6V8R6Y0_TRIAP|nr:hypothetical protein LI328DRAFT_46219 [Trichoderma asperelloides]GFP60042.1 hypothetical protein TASIC1_0015021100 [Trichoderma asperellum]